jgi:hypothetical protein
MSFVNASFSKVIATGVAVAACVAGATVPAAAAPLENPSDAQVSIKATNYVGAGAIRVAAPIELKDGHVVRVGEHPLSNVELRYDARNVPTEMVAKWTSDDINASAVAVYSVFKGGVDTHYVFVPRIKIGVSAEAPKAECRVQPDPSYHERLPPAPYTCTTSKRGWKNDWDFTIAPKAG